jgi:hypothetical protein
LKYELRNAAVFSDEVGNDPDCRSTIDQLFGVGSVKGPLYFGIFASVDPIDPIAFEGRQLEDASGNDGWTAISVLETPAVRRLSVHLNGTG